MANQIAVVVGALLLLIGIAALVRPVMPYSTHEEVLRVGPLQTTVEKQESVRVPPAVSVLILLAGAGFLVLGVRKKT